MSRIGLIAHAQMAALMATMEMPRHQVIVIDRPTKDDDVFAFYGDSTGEFRSTPIAPRQRPAIYKPNGAREVERRRRQREKREARLLPSEEQTK